MNNPSSISPSEKIGVKLHPKKSDSGANSNSNRSQSHHNSNLYPTKSQPNVGGPNNFVNVNDTRIQNQRPHYSNCSNQSRVDPLGQFVQSLKSGIATLVHHEGVQHFLGHDDTGAEQRLKSLCLHSARGCLLFILGREFRFCGPGSSSGEFRKQLNQAGPPSTVQYQQAQPDISTLSHQDRLALSEAQNQRLFIDFQREVSSLYRCTYRKNFPDFLLTREYDAGTNSIVRVDTDAGWGCMIRVGQMLLANLMSRIWEIRETRREKEKWEAANAGTNVSVKPGSGSTSSSSGTTVAASKERFLENLETFRTHQMRIRGSSLQMREKSVKILRYFLDTKSSRFGIANFILLKQAGEWLGPTTVSTTIAALVQAENTTSSTTGKKKSQTQTKNAQNVKDQQQVANVQLSAQTVTKESALVLSPGKTQTMIKQTQFESSNIGQNNNQGGPGPDSASCLLNQNSVTQNSSSSASQTQSQTVTSTVKDSQQSQNSRMSASTLSASMCGSQLGGLDFHLYLDYDGYIFLDQVLALQQCNSKDQQQATTTYHDVNESINSDSNTKSIHLKKLSKTKCQLAVASPAHSIKSDGGSSVESLELHEKDMTQQNTISAAKTTSITHQQYQVETESYNDSIALTNNFQGTHTESVHDKVTGQTQKTTSQALQQQCDKIIISDSQSLSQQQWEKGILILLPFQLGTGDVIDERLRFEIPKFLRIPYSMGILSGRPRKAHYFVGCIDSELLLYLDPHTVQNAATEMKIPATMLQKTQMGSLGQWNGHHGKRLTRAKSDPDCVGQASAFSRQRLKQLEEIGSTVTTLNQNSNQMSDSLTQEDFLVLEQGRGLSQGPGPKVQQQSMNIMNSDVNDPNNQIYSQNQVQYQQAQQLQSQIQYQSLKSVKTVTDQADITGSHGGTTSKERLKRSLTDSVNSVFSGLFSSMQNQQQQFGTSNKFVIQEADQWENVTVGPNHSKGDQSQHYNPVLQLQQDQMTLLQRQQLSKGKVNNNSQSSTDSNQKGAIDAGTVKQSPSDNFTSSIAVTKTPSDVTAKLSKQLNTATNTNPSPLDDDEQQQITIFQDTLQSFMVDPCRHLQILHVSEMNSSLCLAFYVNSQEELQDLTENYLSQTHQSLITVQDVKPKELMELQQQGSGVTGSGKTKTQDLNYANMQMSGSFSKMQASADDSHGSVMLNNQKTKKSLKDYQDKVDTTVGVNKLESDKSQTAVQTTSDDIIADGDTMVMRLESDDGNIDNVRPVQQQQYQQQPQVQKSQQSESKYQQQDLNESDPMKASYGSDSMKASWGEVNLVNLVPNNPNLNSKDTITTANSDNSTQTKFSSTALEWGNQLSQFGSLLGNVVSQVASSAQAAAASNLSNAQQNYLQNQYQSGKLKGQANYNYNNNSTQQQHVTLGPRVPGGSPTQQNTKQQLKGWNGQGKAKNYSPNNFDKKPMEKSPQSKQMYYGKYGPQQQQYQAKSKGMFQNAESQQIQDQDFTSVGGPSRLSVANTNSNQLQHCHTGPGSTSITNSTNNYSQQQQYQQYKKPLHRSEAVIIGHRAPSQMSTRDNFEVIDVETDVISPNLSITQSQVRQQKQFPIVAQQNFNQAQSQNLKQGSSKSSENFYKGGPGTSSNSMNVKGGPGPGNDHDISNIQYPTAAGRDSTLSLGIMVSEGGGSVTSIIPIKQLDSGVLLLPPSPIIEPREPCELDDDDDDSPIRLVDEHGNEIG